MKKVFLFLLIILLFTGIYFHSLLGYAITQGIGQIRITFGARPINKVLLDPSVADSLKRKLRLVLEIKKFAVDSLGLKDSKNYSTFYDQKGKPVLWVVTASEKYRLQQFEWDFPVIGKVPYKGFFKKENAIAEENKLIERSYDTHVGTTSGWSTLGWFRDPVLSGMLRHSEGELANLIIHEMTHASLYLIDSADFNENIASFTGEFGSLYFLEKKYGKDSKEYTDHKNKLRDEKIFNDGISKGVKKLEMLYLSFNESMPDSEKDILKFSMIGQIFEEAESDSLFENAEKTKFRKRDKLPNNAYFLDFIRYDSRKNLFEEELQTSFGSDFKKYFSYLKDRIQNRK